MNSRRDFQSRGSVVSFVRVNHRNTQLLLLGGVALLALMAWGRASGKSAARRWFEQLGLPPVDETGDYAFKLPCPYYRKPIWHTFRDANNINPLAHANSLGIGHISSRISGWGFMSGLSAGSGVTCQGRALDLLVGDIRAVALIVQVIRAAPTIDLAWPDLSPPDLSVLSSAGLSCSIAAYPSEGLGGHLSGLRATCLVHGPDGNSHKMVDGVSVGIVGQHSLHFPRIDVDPRDEYLRGVYLDNG